MDTKEWGVVFEVWIHTPRQEAEIGKYRKTWICGGSQIHPSLVYLFSSIYKHTHLFYTAPSFWHSSLLGFSLRLRIHAEILRSTRFCAVICYGQETIVVVARCISDAKRVGFTLDGFIGTLVDGVLR